MFRGKTRSQCRILPGPWTTLGLLALLRRVASRREMRRQQLVVRVYVPGGQQDRYSSSSAGPCVAPAAGSRASRPTVAAACACTAFLASAHTIHRTAARRLRAHTSEAALQPTSQRSLGERVEQLVRGSLRLGPVADWRARGKWHMTIVSEADRAASTAAIVMARTRRLGVLHASSSLPASAYLAPSVAPRDPLRSTLACQRRLQASRSA